MALIGVERRPAPMEAAAPVEVEAPVEPAAAAAAGSGELESAAAASWRAAALAPGVGVERGVVGDFRVVVVVVDPVRLDSLSPVGKRPTCRHLSPQRKQHPLHRCCHFI